MTADQVKALVIAESDQSWVKHISDYRNIKGRIKDYYESLENMDFYPKTEEEQKLFELFFSWLDGESGESSPGSGFISRVREKSNRTIRILSYGDDDGDDD